MTGQDPVQAQACAALAAWDASDAPPQLIQIRENIVFAVSLGDGTRAALRLHRPGYQTRAAIEAELLWTARLAEQGIPVPAPIPARAGAWTVQAGDRLASCVTWLNGRPIGASWQPLAGWPEEQATLFRRIGGLIARMHDATDDLNLPGTLPRPRWDADGLLGPDPLWGRFLDNPGFTAEDRRRIGAASDVARSILARLHRLPGGFGLIHADVLRENVLDGPTGLSLIDFDDSGFGYRFYDLGTALLQSLEEPAGPALAGALLAGYGTRRALPDDAEHVLYAVTMLRAFASAGWILTRSEDGDPRRPLYVDRARRLVSAVLEGSSPFVA